MIEFLGCISIILVAVISYIVASRLLKSVLDRLVLTFLLIWADLIITALVLSVFKKLFCYTAYFSISLLLLLFLLIVLKLVNVKPLFFLHDSNQIVLTKKHYPILVLLAVLFVLNLITVIVYPPNNWDSMTYHLPRIYLYLSQGDLGHFFTPNERQIFSPFNATLLQLPVVQYGLPDRFFSFINLIAWSTIGVTLYRTSYFIVHNSYVALLSAFFGLTGTAVLAQATTTNNDILLACVFLSAVYFVFLWTKYRNNMLLFVAFIAVGIAVGTKVTVAFFIPGFVLFFLYILLRKKLRPDFKKYLSKINWGIVFASVLLMLILALPSYYINYYESKHLSAPGQNIYVNNKGNYFKTAEQNLLGVTVQALLNPIALFSYDIFSVYDCFSGTAYKHTIPYHINRFIDKVWFQKGWDRDLSFGGDYFFDHFISKHLVEDEVWYGLATYLIIIGLIFILLRKSKFKNELPYIRFLTFICFFFFLSYGVLMRWQPWSCRFFIPAYLLIIPVLSVFLKDFSTYRLSKIIIYIFILLVSFDSVLYVFFNQRRPLKKLNKTYAYGKNTKFEKISKNKKICIVNSSGDQRIYPLMRNGRRQEFILSDRLENGYYNIVSINSVNKPTIGSIGKGLEYLGQYGTKWYGIQL
jgi:hypothetical protein